MKKPKYKKGDFIKSNSPPERSGFIKYILENMVCITPDTRYTDTVYAVTTRKGKREFIGEKEIIRKLPILRDSRGRFSKKEVIYRNGVGFIEKDCTCFNCDKCAEQMRAYYERTGELKPGNVTKGPVKNNTGGGKIKETISADYKVRLFHECGIKFEDWETTIPRTEEKKPSDRIDEIYRKIEPMFSDRRIAMIAAIGDYLDECWEKGRNE